MNTTTMTARRMPIVFAASGGPEIPGVWADSHLTGEAEAIVVIAPRQFGDRGTSATLGTHVLSPSHKPAGSLEERVNDALILGGLDAASIRRVTAKMPLPAGIAESSVPIIVVSLNLALPRERFEPIGRSLRALRERGIILTGVAADTTSDTETPELAATVAVLLGAAQDDDLVAELGQRTGDMGFVLSPDLSSEQTVVWNVEGAGEMSFRQPDEHGDNGAVRKKKSSGISITRFDKARLQRLLRTLESGSEIRTEIEDLAHELERGTEVESADIAADIVTMNSTVRVTDTDAGTTHLYTIVFPADADYERGRISILSPLGTALLGYRAGDVVTWEMPGGTRQLRIEELVYQPEAAGDFHL